MFALKKYITYCWFSEPGEALALSVGRRKVERKKVRTAYIHYTYFLFLANYGCASKSKSTGLKQDLSYQ